MDKTLLGYARVAAHYGDRSGAHHVLLVYGDYKVWADKTRRTRWDGAALLLT